MHLYKSSPFKISNLILLFIISLCPSIFAGAPDTLWTRTYGGVSDDRGISVQQLDDGGFIIVGHTGSSEHDSEDVYLLRTNSNGDSLWTKSYGGASNDEGYQVQVLSDGGFIITGATESFGSGRGDVYIIRTNSSGDTLWTKTHGGDLGEGGISVLQTSDGGFIFAGLTNSFGAGNYDVYLIKTNSNGDSLWTKTYGDTMSDFGYSIYQTNDNGFIICGQTYNIDDYVGNVYLLRTDSTGDTLWTKTYGGERTDYGYSVQQTSDNGFIIGGSTSSFGAGETDIYLIKTDSNGDTLWTRTYGGEERDGGWSVQQTSDGGFIITGATESFGSGRGDVYIIRTNSSGDTLWTKTYGGSEIEEGRSIQQTNDGGYIITGYSTSFSAGHEDVYLIRLDKETTEIKEDNPNNFINSNNFIINGDTRNNLISIRYTIQHSSAVKLSIYNISGQLVKTLLKEYKSRGEYSEQFKTEKISAGVYYVTLEVGESRYTRKSVVVE